MQKKSIFKLSLLAIAILSTNAFALEFGKPLTASVAITNPTNKRSAADKKEVVLMNILLSRKQQQALMSYQPRKENSVRSVSTELPAAVDLKMNNVPVLDQGQHGSCVTFATVAAVDAVIGKGNYVSPLCSLELGSYLEKEGYMPSGWNGAYGGMVLDQMQRFGVISMNNQYDKSCAHMTDYPLNSWTNEGSAMSLDDYKAMSEDVSRKFYPVFIMNFTDRFEEGFDKSDKMENVLLQVKQHLAKGNRVTFGTFLDIVPFSKTCSGPGSCATYHAAQDTWAVAPELDHPLYAMTAGHEMVITGYDDNAEATDSAGTKHKGLLILRNSWGAEVGDHGNFYMTYDYFKRKALEVQAIVASKE